MFSAFENIVFDLDGTLIDSASGVVACLIKTVGEVKAAADQSKLNRDLIGPPLETMIKTLCPTESAEKQALVVRTFRRIYDADPTVGCSVFPQASRLLGKLRMENKRLFVATNKFSTPALAVIDRLGLGRFEAVFTPDMKEWRRMTKAEMLQALISEFGLDKVRTVMVGDAVSDMTAAHQAGIKGSAVLWGYEKEAARLRSEADFIFEEQND